jgi:hypothetical protein
VYTPFGEYTPDRQSANVFSFGEGTDFGEGIALAMVLLVLQRNIGV